ncbi:similar to Saccharomyces cerevisiae YMR068W AVO2 Component of a complex containing the Tor2p kinase and other proteins, which may have a role in regulation of cell growth [Maudiozyma barnettii]|uniref:Similar to Saccharomyces cerevisiae YMR068W AVO2 Component of a complex containing the Tor2p kinase and other proteins, which may have a role in regulation of cell growth n=1 Tax=Maudiozyma barnettii TaxID=61262 RepID=A0A8H2VJR0_9SACH|nr:Avo2p [Kazachstania barnettii]CAB4256663.1 similar to Saccharomyces cerevisiae YMR068W AVO2 Component of a complex containing the Tor2p kinase and other proteins, which may have a role in regulation of cell growth [Kazachstania barnettii]CAD1785318.1 similar to Saccharomyces cerevisiae YMR068W AVO2 Component of a complex containing the Tor2p kinase and other proteins, which may have a role in regulation of cell growth [Kazachstania barnettii]
MLCDLSHRLRNAIISGNLLTVKRILRRFPELLTNVDPENGWSSLHYASYHGRYLICVYLLQLDHGKREYAKTFKGNTCVHLSLMNGHEQTAHLLLQHFPNFINQRGGKGRTPLHVVCLKDYYQCLALLMSAGADLTVADSNGDTALHICMEYGSLQCLRILLKDGNLINDDIKDRYNWKPSEVAITFDFAKLYNKIRKDIKVTETTMKKPLIHALKTPVLETKSTFDAGPSPVLTMNSPYTSISLNSTLPPLPTIATSRKQSTTALSKQSFTPLTALPRKSLSNSSLVSSDLEPASSIHSGSTASSRIQELNNVLEQQASNAASTIRNHSNSIVSTQSHVINNNTIQNNKNILNNLGEEAHKHGLSFLSINTHKDTNDPTSPTDHLSPSIRKKSSLLSIPFSKLRNSSINSTSTISASNKGPTSKT